MFPRLFHIGNFSLPTYGLLVSLGVLIGLWISVRNSEKQGINGDDAWNLGILVVLCGILGAKILYIVNDWTYYSTHLGEIFSFATLQAGGVFSGGLIGGFSAAAWYVRKRRMPALATCDAFAPGLAFGHALGRVGCFRGRLLLWQADDALLGGNFHQSYRTGMGGNATGSSAGADTAF